MSEEKTLYEKWCKCAVKDPDITEELKKINGNNTEIKKRFCRQLEFGTAGLRGIIGAGTNRMNIYTVNQATQGLADSLNKKYNNPSVAIAYDSRIKSDIFAKSASSVLSANGIKVYLFSEISPVATLSFAVRHLKCQAGIMITASHNPASYNGFKCYSQEGFQMTDEEAADTFRHIRNTDIFSDIKIIDFDQAVSHGKIEYISRNILNTYYEKVLNECNKDVCKDSSLKIIYTPLNGAGNKPVRHILKSLGFENIFVVPEQENPDGNFTTCPSPNPEYQKAFECAIKYSEKFCADLILATDPDCDRVGVAVRHRGKYRLLNGNETGALLTDYILSQKKNSGKLKNGSYVVKSIVTSELISKIAKKYGCRIKNLLTGFKYIGEFISELDKKGEADKFVIGMEESYGYLTGTYARDKDAVIASAQICEMASFFKKQNLTLVDVLERLYKEHGYFKHSLINYEPGSETGMAKIKDSMEILRSNPPESFGDFKVVTVLDYLKGRHEETQTGIIKQIYLPKSNVLEFRLENNSSIIIRPSGTEPKMKIYLNVCGRNKIQSEKISASLTEAVETIFK